jgi:DNA polymerase III alpha subunit
MAAKKAGIRAHIGAEVTCTDGHRYPLLAESRTGYQNLCRLITRMKMRAKKGEGAATPEELAEFSKGLVCLASRPDPQSSTLFGAKNVYVELQRHFNRNQEAHNQALIDFARSAQRLPLLATNGVSHATPNRAKRSTSSPASAQSHHPRSRTPALHQLRALLERRPPNVAHLRRPSGSHRQHPRTFRSSAIHPR